MVFSTSVSNTGGVDSGTIQNISSNIKKERILKILLTLGFILTMNNFFILFFHQPKGYIVDIYSALPLIFFLSLIICYSLGSSTILFGQGIIRKLGIVLLVFTHSAVLLIPYMLGYYSMGRADDMSYIGEYLQIITSGTIAGWDIYPASHMIGATLSIVTGLEPQTASFVIPFIFSFLLVGGLFLCSRCLLEDQVLVNIAIPSSFILYLGPYNFLNVPHALFFAIMPLFIFLLWRFIKDQNFSNIVSIVLLIILVPFMHPFIVLFVLSTSFALIIFSRFLKRFINVNYQETASILIITLTSFAAWFIFSTRLLGRFGQSYSSYVEKTTEPVFLETTEKLARINIDLYKIIKLVTIYYGRYVIPFLIITLALIIIYLKRDRISQLLKNRLVFGVFFYIFFLILEMILFFNPIISHQPDRLTNLNFMVYAQIPLFVLSLYVILVKPKSSNQKMVLLLLILASTWGLSLFGTFDSPNIFRPNAALSHNEVQGMEWFYDSKTSDNIFIIMSPINRFHDLFADGEKDLLHSIPEHFGYRNDSQSFAEINLKTGKQSYIIILTFDELLYQKVPGYMEVGRYNANDFRRFRDDTSANKIFDDMNIEIYYEVFKNI